MYSVDSFISVLCYKFLSGLADIRGMSAERYSGFWTFCEELAKRRS